MTKKQKLRVTLYINKAAAKTTKAADPATVNLFKAAPFVDVDGALDGGVEIDDGVIAGVAWGDAAVELAEGEIAGDGAWDGGVEIDDGVTAGAAAGEAGAAAGGDVGELTANSEGEGALFTGELAEGEIAGDGNGEDMGDDGGDRATVEPSNSPTKSINTKV